jgi:hypothetical protein
MAAVSQRIPNFLGGVSQQADERKFPGQVRDALNAYPDVTLGLIKRPGGKFLAQLKQDDGTVIPPGYYDNAAPFMIFRDQVEEYFMIVKNGEVETWSLKDGTKKATVTDPVSKAYLTDQ